MKRICALVLFLYACIYSIHGQLAYVYSSEGTPTIISCKKPANRKVIGGTVINVTYHKNVGETLQGAFEYACRIWEENIPTTYPLKIYVNMAPLSEPNALAAISSVPSSFLENADRVYEKRYWQQPYTMASDMTLKYLRDESDVAIVFANDKAFDYSIDEESVKTDHYDFVTVALQAIGKALGFSFHAYVENGVLTPKANMNQYTNVFFNNRIDYQKATSGNVQISYLDTNRKTFNLYSPPTFSPEYSLSFFEEDPNNQETLIMQLGISKESIMRYVGKGMQAYFSFSGWDKDHVVGIGGSTQYDPASTIEIIPFQKPEERSTLFKSSDNNMDTEIDLSSYIDFCSEDGQESGLYVLLKDGRWMKFDNYRNLSIDMNDQYARTSDGFLRLKYIWTDFNGMYPIQHVEYQLYDYIPQVPSFANDDIRPAQDLNKHISRKPFSAATLDASNLYETTFGFKHTEGCESVIVEQTDEDTGIPYTYVIDPKEGQFTAYMDIMYASSFKLTYIYKNGQAESETKTVKIPLQGPAEARLEVYVNGNTLTYRILSGGALPPPFKKNHTKYTIYDINGNVLLNGTNQYMPGTVDISSLAPGYYMIEVQPYIPGVVGYEPPKTQVWIKSN